MRLPPIANLQRTVKLRPILTAVICGAAFIFGAAILCGAAVTCGAPVCLGIPAAAKTPQQAPGPAREKSAPTQTASSTTSTSSASSTVVRGKKLVLQDGSYQLVREYEKNGERIRYFSIERGAWEEIPAAMVDWEATKKAEAAEERTDAALLDKVRIQEAATHAQTPIDVDASLTVAPGVFLPEGEGMFAVEGKTVRQIGQAGSQIKTDKKTVLKQIFTPVPIVASKRNVELPGARAAVRLTSSHPEFFLREPPPDPDRHSTIERSGRLGDEGPEVVLMRAKVKGNKRLLESIRSYFGQEVGEERQEIAMQRWDVAPDVYRFTLGEPLPPGEYAFAEILPDGLNLYVWDFAVEAASQQK